jgi:hypothetical protein
MSEEKIVKAFKIGIVVTLILLGLLVVCWTRSQKTALEPFGPAPASWNQ